MSEEVWNDGGFVGTIKKYDIEPHAPTEYENMDDYDVRNGFGMRMRNARSRFTREEC